MAGPPDRSQEKEARRGSAVEALAAARLVLAVILGLRLALSPFAAAVGQPDALWHPRGTGLLFSSPPPVSFVVVVQVLGVAGAAMYVWRRRLSPLVLAWLCLLVLAGLRTSLGKILHNDVLLLLAGAPLLLAGRVPSEELAPHLRPSGSSEELEGSFPTSVVTLRSWRPASGLLVPLRSWSPTCGLLVPLRSWRPATSGLLVPLRSWRPASGLLVPQRGKGGAFNPARGPAEELARTGLDAAAAVVLLSYLSAGWWKLVRSGPAWVFSDNLRWSLAAGRGGSRWPALSGWLVEHPPVCIGLAGGIIALELGAALVWLRPRLVPAFVGAAVVMHAGTWLVLGLDYWVHLAAVALVLLPWARMRRR